MRNKNLLWKKIALAALPIAFALLVIFYPGLIERKLDNSILFLILLAILVFILPWERLTSLKAAGIELVLDKPQIDRAIRDLKVLKEKENVSDEKLMKLLERYASKIEQVKGSRILWIDDTPNNILGERRLLRALGIDTIMAISSEMAQKHLDTDGDFDLIISDIRETNEKDETESPEAVLFIIKLRNTETLRSQKERYSHIPSLPVIFYSSKSREQLRSYIKLINEKRKGARIDFAKGVEELLEAVLIMLYDVHSEPIKIVLGSTSPSLPVINISPLLKGTGDQKAVASQIGQACREYGFFYITGHGVDDALQQRLEDLSHQFFAQDLDTKLKIRMALGGKAWRGYFPVGEELTSGKPDLKEGIYFGTELGNDDPRVQDGIPLHGPNLFPAHLPAFRETVLDYMEAMTHLGHTLMRGIALSLGLEKSYFANRYTSDPLILFRIFHYPPSAKVPDEEPQWGVGEHTDYGVLTILKQDDAGGLQIKSKSQWTEAPPVPGSFVCNIGDMLDRMTQGLYRSTPHRVRNLSNRGRLSFPFFFDPNFDAKIEPIDLSGAKIPVDDKHERWDKASVHEFKGTYGDYILGKVSKVFPELRRDVI